jgi:hypothetical protein
VYTQDTPCTAGPLLLSYGRGTDIRIILQNARQFAMPYHCRCLTDANVFRRLLQRLHETGSVTTTTLVKAGHARTVRISAADDIIAAVGRGL